MFQIDNLNSFDKFTKQHPELTNKLIVARFKMEGCSHCINSQPKWDKMMDDFKTSYMMQPNMMLLEIDSSVTDNFLKHHRIVSEDRQPYSVSGYPEHAFIDQCVIYPSNSDVYTTMKSIRQQLVKHKAIKKINKKTKTKTKTKKRKN